MLDYKKIYTKDYFQGKTSFFYKAFGYRDFIHFDQYFKTVKPYLQENSKVLDVGCALGFLAKRFAKENHRVWGIDVSEYAIITSQKEVPGSSFLVHNAEEKFPFSDNFFDAAMAIDILEHLEYPDAALENINRVLKPGGVIFLGSPNNNVLRKIFFSIPDKLEHHISLRSIDQLEKMLLRSNFELIDSWTTITALTSQIKFPRWISPETRIVAKKKAT